MHPWPLTTRNNSPPLSPLHSPRPILSSSGNLPPLALDSIKTTKIGNSESNDSYRADLPLFDTFPSVKGSEDIKQANNCRFSSEMHGQSQSLCHSRAREAESISPARAAKRQRKLVPVKGHIQHSHITARSADLEREQAIGGTDQSCDEQQPSYWQPHLSSENPLHAAQDVWNEHDGGGDIMKLWVHDHDNREGIHELPLGAMAGAKSQGTELLFPLTIDHRFSASSAMQRSGNDSVSSKGVDRKKWQYGVKRCALSIVHYFTTSGGGHIQQDKLVELLLCEEAAKLGRYRSQLSAIMVKGVKRRAYDVLNILAGSGNLSRDNNNNEDKRVVTWEGHEGHKRLLENLKGNAQTREEKEREEIEGLERVLEEKKWILVDLRRKLWIVQRMKDIAAEYENLHDTSPCRRSDARADSSVALKGKQSRQLRGICRPFIAFKSASKIHVYTRDQGASKTVDLHFEGPHEMMSEWEFAELFIDLTEWQQ